VSSIRGPRTSMALSQSAVRRVVAEALPVSVAGLEDSEARPPVLVGSRGRQAKWPDRLEVPVVVAQVGHPVARVAAVVVWRLLERPAVVAEAAVAEKRRKRTRFELPIIRPLSSRFTQEPGQPKCSKNFARDLETETTANS